MATKGYGRNHNPAAWELMESYKKGIWAEDPGR